MVDILFNSILIFNGPTNNKLVTHMALCFYILEGVIFFGIFYKNLE